MTTPTRDQVTAAPLDAYSAEDRAFFAFWYAHMKDDMMQPPLNTVHHAVARLIYTAGRDQGLREAAARARSEGIAGISADDDEIVAEWLDAAAIEQLRA